MNKMDLIKKLRFLWIGVVLLVPALILEPSVDTLRIPPIREQVIQNNFEERVELLNRTADNLIARLGDKDWQEFSINEKDFLEDLIHENRVAFFVFRDTNLMFWSDRSISASKRRIQRLADQQVSLLPNAWVYSRIYQCNDYSVIGLIPLKWVYPFENDYVTNQFLFSSHIPSGYEITLEPQEGASVVVIKENQPLFSLHFSGQTENPDWLFWMVTFLYLLVILCILGLLHDIYSLVMFRWPSNWWLVGLLADLILFRFGMDLFKFPGVLFETELFHPWNDTVWFFGSRGDFLLTALFMLFFAIHFYKSFHLYPRNEHRLKLIKDNPRLLDTFAILGWALVAFVFLGMVLMVKELFLLRDGLIEIYRVLTIDFALVMDVFTAMIISASFLLFSLRIIRQMKLFHHNYRLMMGLLMTLVVIYGMTRYFGLGPNWIAILFLVFTVLLFVIIDPFAHGRIPHAWIVILLIFLSSWMTHQIFTVNTDKEEVIQREILQSLSNEHDPIAEMLFRQIDTALIVDTTLQKLVFDPSVNFDRTEVEQRIANYLKSQYFDLYWSRYNIQANLCDSLNLLLISPDNLQVPCLDYFTRNVQEALGQQLPDTHFYYLDNFDGLINYLGVLPTYSSDSSFVVYLFISVDSRWVNQELGYPELLISKEYAADSLANTYSYAKYQSGILNSRTGDYRYSTTADHYPGEMGQIVRFRMDGYDHVIYRLEQSNAIVISRPAIRFVDFLITFSYIFVFTYAIWVILSLFRLVTTGFQGMVMALKQRIQTTMIGILVISFLVIGVGLIYYNTRQYDQSTRDIIVERSSMLLTELQHKLDKEPRLSPGWHDGTYSNLKELLVKFSFVFNTDINLFDPFGNLLESSRPEVFDQNLSGRRMDPMAFLELHDHQKPSFIHREKIGKLGYYSSYVPFYNVDQQILAYLNLPYFARQKEMSLGLSTFLVAILNIYFLLIFITVIVTVFLSNQVTKPLGLLQEKLAAVQLGAMNQSIEYHRNDEIGSLVREYNRMVAELQRSAELLARSERESAWREMARQIAHEIKNPLTPMKLTVQHLQKAWKDDQLTRPVSIEKFTNTLIDQIDTLATIAGEFARFAQMPKANYQPIDILQRIRSTLILFEDSAIIRLVVTEPVETILVKIDKEQIVQVFNNLLRNAIQAVSPGTIPHIDINIDCSSNWVTISVSDNGLGISEEAQQKLFQPNFTTKSSGTGLGLAITKNIIESGGGEISFSSKPGEGTTFLITLPHFSNS